jgi:transposase
MATKHRKRTEDLPVLHPDTAGIDVGASELFVAVPADRDPAPVRSYPTFTKDLHELADWLQSCGIRSVAMESTSVYWIPVYQILEARGIEVFLVNAHYLKNVPGRKSDVSDCQWIQYLHSVGLLRTSFRPTNATTTNQRSFDLRSKLYRILGVDLTEVPGISGVTAHTILCEIGPDMAAFRNASAFASWLGLCPERQISGAVHQESSCPE